MHVVPLLPTKPAPSHLSTEAKSWWSQLVAEFSITDPGGLLLLQTACEAYDRMQQARRAIEADGLMSKGSKRQARAHPLLAVEHDAQKALLASLRALNLDLEPLRDRPGRPAGGWGAK